VTIEPSLSNQEESDRALRFGASISRLPPAHPPPIAGTPRATDVDDPTRTMLAEYERVTQWKASPQVTKRSLMDSTGVASVPSPENVGPSSSAMSSSSAASTSTTSSTTSNQVASTPSTVPTPGHSRRQSMTSNNATAASAQPSSGSLAGGQHSRRSSGALMIPITTVPAGGRGSQPASRRNSAAGPNFYVDDELNATASAMIVGAADTSTASASTGAPPPGHHRRRSSTATGAAGGHSRQGSMGSGNGGHRRQGSSQSSRPPMTEAERARQAAFAEIFHVRKDENIVEPGGEPIKKQPTNDGSGAGADNDDDISDPDMTPPLSEHDEEEDPDDHSEGEDPFAAPSTTTVSARGSDDKSNESSSTGVISTRSRVASDTVALAADSGDDSDNEARQLPEWMRRRTEANMRTPGTTTTSGTGESTLASPASPATPGFSPLAQLAPVAAPQRAPRGQRFSLAQIDYDTVDVAALTRSVSGRGVASPREMAAAVQGRGGGVAGKAFAAGAANLSVVAGGVTTTGSSSTLTTTTTTTLQPPMSPTGTGSGSFASPVRLHRSPNARSPMSRTGGGAFPPDELDEHKDILSPSSIPSIINRTQVALDAREKKRLLALRTAESFNPLTLERMPSRILSSPRSPLGGTSMTSGGWSTPMSPGAARGSMISSTTPSRVNLTGPTIAHQHMIIFMDETVDEGQEFVCFLPNTLQSHILLHSVMYACDAVDIVYLCISQSVAG
jgi:hypothetical protein